MFAWILKTKPEKPGVSGDDEALVGQARLRRRRQRLERAASSASRPKLSSALPKKTGVCVPARYSARSNGRAGALDERRVVDERRVRLLAEQLDEHRDRGVGGAHRRAEAAARHALVEARLLRDQVEHAAEAVAAADRPVHRRRLDAEHVLDLVEQLERIAARQVELVDEGEDRQPAQPAHLEQLARLRLDALGGVDHHDDAVDREERAVGVFAEVLVAGRVEQRDAAAAELEVERGRRHRDAALALDVHPVGDDVALRSCGRARRRPARWRRHRAAASRSASSCRRRGAR